MITLHHTHSITNIRRLREQIIQHDSSGCRIDSEVIRRRYFSNDLISDEMSVLVGGGHPCNFLSNTHALADGDVHHRLGEHRAVQVTFHRDV